MIETDNVLTEALAQALETMAFLTIMPLEEDMVAPENAVLAEMSFTGPKTGAIQILAGLDFAKLLAENIGALDEVDDETAFDAMKELSNVTCGLLLPVLGSSPADVFNITVPAVDSGDNSPGWDEFTADQDSCVLNIEGYLVATRLIIKD
jgi:CheY-specific phosphatase CheX